MKIFNQIKSGFAKVALAVLLASPLAVSCYDDSALQEQIDMIVDQLFELEQKMNSEIKALKSMLTGQAFISNVSRDAATGVTTITLSDGTKLQLLPEKDLESYVTYMTLGDGENYWAYIDKDGKKQLFLDSEGKAVPVLADVPEVITEGDDTFIVIGGVSYPLSGNSVFSDYELITDELSGEIYAVTFTFGEDMTFTVTVDGACGFHFVKPAGWSTVIVSDWYVANGVTERVQVDARGVVDYVLQIPDGWRVKEYKDIYMGGLYFDITAPSKELVESGIAAAEGDLKVVAVLEGGKATVARLYLTTSPFKTFGVSLGNANAEMYNGLQKFVYGICAKADFDEASIFETAEGLLGAFSYPSGYGISDSDLSESVAQILGSEPYAGESYVFWALPALYYQTADDAGYYLSEETFVTAEFKYASVEFEISDERFRDAVLTLNVAGADSYHMGLVPAEEFLLEDLLYGLNASYYEPLTTPMSYTGSIFSLTGVTAEPATDYVAWIALAEAGKTYAASDVIVREFSTLKLEAGGSVKVVAGDASVTALEVVVPLAADGAENIYYAYMTASDAKKYADDDAKATYLLEKGKSVSGTSVEARLSDFITKTKPSTAYVLFATASDAEGKYGEVLTAEYSTTAIAYNDLKVEMELVKNDPGNVVVNVSAPGSAGLLYWIGKTSDNTWKSSNYLGGSAETAQAWMYLNADHSRLVTVMEKYPVVDGAWTMTDLDIDTDYVIVAMAKDTDGSYSKATEFRFTTRPVAIGTVVLSSDPKWKSAEPTLKWLEQYFTQSSGGTLPGSYGFEITIPMGYTAYVLAATDSYLNNGDSSLILTPEDKILGIIKWTDKPRDWHLTTSDDWVWPHIGYEHYHSPHGAPLWGNSVIWASQEFHDSVCDCGGNYVEQRELNGYMVDITHIININNGEPFEFRQPSAIASTQEVIDRVFVVCQDLDGNCYEPFEYDVPIEMFANAGGRDE